MTEIRSRVEPQLASEVGCGHDVHFYRDEHVFSEAIARFVMDGLAAGDTVVLIASVANGAAIQARLRDQGVDLEDAMLSGSVLFSEAREVLREFMVGAMPDAERFRRAVGRLLPDAGAGRLRLYGGMVDLLCRDGNHEGALRLEDLWNDLARDREFTLLCAYAYQNLYREVNGRIYDQICQRHARVVPLAE